MLFRGLAGLVVPCGMLERNLPAFVRCVDLRLLLLDSGLESMCTLVNGDPRVGQQRTRILLCVTLMTGQELASL